MLTFIWVTYTIFVSIFAFRLYIENQELNEINDFNEANNKMLSAQLKTAKNSLMMCKKQSY